MRGHSDGERLFPAFILVAILLGGFLFFAACGNEKEVLTKQIADVRDQAKSLERILSERNDQIKKLEEEQKALKERIPEFHIVAPGESHWQVAREFLIKTKSVSIENAGALLAGSVLFDKILVGHLIGNYYAEGEFGTFVTKGQAVASPAQLLQAEALARDAEKAKLVRQMDELGKRNATGEEKRAELEETWAAREKILESRAKGSASGLAESEARAAVLETKLNSFSYLIGSRGELKARGILRGTFLGICGDRIQNVTPADYQKSLDLRKGSEIMLRAAEVGLSRIRRVMLFPREFRDGVDFRLEIAPDGLGGKLQLLDKAKFALSRIMIVLE
jgi:hypothetical protein